MRHYYSVRQTDWREKAYGKAVAEQCQGMPHELAEQLAPVAFGPATQEIQLMLPLFYSFYERDSYTAALLSQNLMKGLFLRRLKQWIKVNPVLDALDTVLTYNTMQDSYTAASYNSVPVLCWLLNGQYLFPEPMVKHSQRVIPAANMIFSMLELPHLAKKLEVK